ncbi:MAG: M23 family metallopeptidase [bacterium]|nr:M23 family metallopeptidase [Candidatus Sumerlaeota bacterium]
MFNAVHAVRKITFTALVVSMVLLCGCTLTPMSKSSNRNLNMQASALHQVRQGETMDSIARSFGATPAELAACNNLQAGASLAPGNIIRIPSRHVENGSPASLAWWNPFGQLAGTNLSDAIKVIGKAGSQRSTQEESPPIPALARRAGAQLAHTRASDEGRVRANFVTYNVSASYNEKSREGYSWPLIGCVTRPFDDVLNHRGIDIKAPPGTPIHAASDGRVIYSGNELSGFGNMVIIDHGGNVATVYAHNRCNLVRPGMMVKRGQTIAEVGQTGRATCPHLHFEVRHSAQAVDPYMVLP